jgi:hypothetical protein
MFSQLPSAGLSGDSRIPATVKSVAGPADPESLSKRPKEAENNGRSGPSSVASEAGPLRRVADEPWSQLSRRVGKFSSPSSTLNFEIGVPHANDSIANPGSLDGW